MLTIQQVFNQSRTNFEEIFPEKSDIKLNRKELRNAYISHNLNTVVAILEAVRNELRAKAEMSDKGQVVSTVEIDSIIAFAITDIQNLSRNT